MVSHTNATLPSSSVLVIGHPQPKSLQFGAYCVDHQFSLDEQLPHHEFAVVVFNRPPGQGVVSKSWLQKLRQFQPRSYWVVISDGINPSSLLSIIGLGSVSGIVENYSDGDLERQIQLALERFQEDRQGEQLSQLIVEQQQSLQHLTTQLEARVERRQKSLRRSQEKLEQANQRIRAWQAAMLSIHKANSVAELQTQLCRALKDYIPLASMRVLLAQQSSLTQKSAEMLEASQAYFAVPMTAIDKDIQGRILFVRAQGEFTSLDKDFLNELGEAVTLALVRFAKLQMTESLKQQWESTFDAILEPLCLTDDKFQIVKTNRSFAQKIGLSFKKIINQNCFELFFGTAAEFEILGPNFKIRHALVKKGVQFHYEVSSQALEKTREGRQALLVIFRDITQQIRLERKILESSKMAELGTIGSSIAHELNNPLGGMLSFIQLMRLNSQLPAQLLADLQEMEKATLKCRDIVQNLLGFSRWQESQTNRELDLHEVLDRSIRLMELQTKAKGIHIDIDIPDRPLRVFGNLNALSQVVCNLLQSGIDAISEKMQSDPRYAGQIKIHVSSQKAMHQLTVIDNGLHSKSGLGLTVAYTIVAEHRGTLEIQAQTGSQTTAKMSLPSLDFKD